MRRPTERSVVGLALFGLLAASAYGEESSRPRIEAHRTDVAPQLDGVLDDPVWAEAEVGTDFTQLDPNPGAPPSEPTAFRVVYTSTTLFLGIEAQVAKGDLRAKEMERDRILRADDSILIVLDTFRDQRNAYVFSTNPNGAKTDRLITDEGRDINDEWDGVWRSRARIQEDRWVAEIAIPFSTLRFDPSEDTWGLNVQRVVGHRNEESHWAALPSDMATNPSMSLRPVYRVSLAGELHGLRDLRTGRQLDIKPYLLASIRDRPLEDRATEDAELGLDLKWGITRSLALDLTVNTDFAEVEVDDQQVNLTRFSLFFPEKREFFLENAGIFDFGPAQRFEFDPPLLKIFFSRRVGLEAGNVIPIDWGARVTGRVGGWNVGFLDVQTDEAGGIASETNFSVARIKRNVFGRSTLGAIVTQRAEKDGSTRRVYGLDFDYKPTRNTSWSGFLSQSSTDDPSADDQEDDLAWGTGFQYQDRELTASFDINQIEESFDPSMGFLLRRDVRLYNPRIRYLPVVNKAGILNWFTQAEMEYFERASDGLLESRIVELSALGMRTKRNDLWSFVWVEQTERLFEPFDIFPGVTIPTGTYQFSEWRLQGRSNQGRVVGVRGRISLGDFWTGERLGWFLRGSFRPNTHFRAETAWSYNDVDLPQGAFETSLYQQRFDFTFTPNLRLNAIAQYSDAAEEIGVNIRFNWIYRPGADLFVVYNENWQAPTFDRRQTTERQLLVKFTYLFRR